MSVPLGGTISTMVTKSPLANFCPRRERCPIGTAGIGTGPVPLLTCAAIAANYVGTPVGKAGAKYLRRGAVEAVTVFIDGHLRNNRNIRVHVTRGQQRLMEFLDVAERLQNDEIDAAFDQSSDLFAECGAGIFERRLAERLDTDAKRTYRPTDPPIEALGCLTGEPGSGKIYFVNPVGHAVPGQTK